MSKAPIWTVAAPGARRPRFTRDEIAAAAIEIADREGFGELSMRRIAEVLGAGTMTLYYYIRTKDDLFALVDDALMGEVCARTEPLPEGWRAAVAKVARATRDTYVSHSWALHSLRGIRVGPNNLRHIEQSLAAVSSLDTDLPTKFEVLSIVDDYTFGHILRVGEATSEPPPDAKSMQAMNKTMLGYLAGGAYPQLAALVGDQPPVAAFARFAQHMTGDHRFDVGLDALLDGLEARFRLREHAREARDHRVRVKEAPRNVLQRPTERGPTTVELREQRAKLLVEQRARGGHARPRRR